jgi:hypothetical protein
MAKDTAKVWLGRFPVLDESHADELDAAAAVHEFGDKRMPREAAEARAHQDYMRDRALDSAAHHLLGVRAAHASGHDEAATKHGEAYAGAMKAAGLNPFEPPHKDVLDRIKTKRPEVYAFKAHPADQFFVPEHREADPADDHIKALLERLQALRAQLK